MLGDLYYHGPRNPLPKEYDPMQVASLLNQKKDKILAVKGNCDAEVDQMISAFPMKKYLLLEVNGKKVFFTHGQTYNKDHLPKEEIDILIYGHFHTGFIVEERSVLCANAGSLSIPKEETQHSYLVIEKEGLFLKNIQGNVLQERQW